MQQKNLLKLFATTAVFVGLALGAVIIEGRFNQSSLSEEFIFPQNNTFWNTVARIEITDDQFSVLLTKQEQSWRIENSSNYPASHLMMNHLLQGMRDIVLLEKKTDNPEYHERLHLKDPHSSDSDKDIRETGIRLRLANDTGDVLGTWIVGKLIRKPLPSHETSLMRKGEFYIRKEDSNQTWIAQSTLVLPQGLQSFFDQDLSLPQSQDIQAVRVEPANGSPAFTFNRENKDSVLLLPEKKENDDGLMLKNSEYGTDLASALSFFAFEDVRPINQISFENPTKVFYRLFNGTGYVLKVVKKDGTPWVSIESTDPKVQEKTKDWAFKVNKMRMEFLLQDKNEVFKPVS